MINVSLDKFTFALPICLSLVNENEIQANVDIPHEFFGLNTKIQLAVIDGVMKFVSNMSSNIATTEPITSDLPEVFPMNIGIGVCLREEKGLKAEITFSNQEWMSIDNNVREKAIKSIVLLLQTVGVSIFNREAIPDQ